MEFDRQDLSWKARHDLRAPSRGAGRLILALALLAAAAVAAQVESSPSRRARAKVAVTVAERAYLGEFWDYLVMPPDSPIKLRVTTPPLDIYQVGEQAWLAFDPKQMTPIS